ncbi:MAG: LPS export ABC transporter permease LptF [Betaproteobacteria bacterium]|nr:LPS export ABC transporter permease LptF [Betaproteobacteria bacterium]
MVFLRAARREFTHTAAGIFVALFAIMVTTQMIRLLGQAASGRIAPEAVAALLGFAALNYLPILLSITLFISILLSLSRSYRDSEMVVWFSSGLPLTAWIRPVLLFTFPFLLGIVVLSLFLSPWALSMSAEYRERLSLKSDASQVSPGSFKEASSQDRVVFVEAVSEDASFVRNVFVSSMQHGRLGVVMAATGRQEIAQNGDRFLVLENGRRYEVEPGTPEFRILEFEKYAIRVQEQAPGNPEKTPRTMPLLDLLRDDSDGCRAEAVWRFGVPISALVLALIAIPLSFVNPRAGRSVNMLMAIFTYMIYNNLLSVSQAWVAQGKISFALGFCAVHGLMLLILPLLFARRIFVFSFLRLART